MRGIVARRRSTIHPVAFPLALIIVLVTVIALIGIRVYRREEGRAPYLRQLADGEITVDEVPPSLQKALASPKHRAALASTLRKIARDAAKTPRRRIIPNTPLTHHFREGVRSQISDVADLIERPEAPPEAVALAELLLGDGASPFYGEHEEPLVRELRRLRAAAQSTEA
jgi:hypothetical protein